MSGPQFDQREFASQERGTTDEHYIIKREERQQGIVTQMDGRADSYMILGGKLATRVAKIFLLIRCHFRGHFRKIFTCVMFSYSVIKLDTIHLQNCGFTQPPR